MLPANEDNGVLYSHQGLTYGGLIMNENCGASGILECFSELRDYLIKEGFKKLIYKPVPHIYPHLPSEEDLYALFRNNAKLIGRNISCTILQSNRIKYSNLRKRTLRKVLNAGLEISESKEYEEFWKVLIDNLFEKYGAHPVHSLEEIVKLSSLFPQIKLFVAKKKEKILAGIVFYVTPKVVHAQYISATKEGKSLGAVDAIINFGIEHFAYIPYFDMGTSNADQGRFLNESLIHHKEGFGGRGICYDSYELDI